MSSGLAELTARRIALQAQCAAQRGELTRVYGDIERGIAPVDGVAIAVRTFLPLAAVVSITVLIVLGPARALAAVRQGLALAMTASDALRAVRGLRA